MKSVNLTKRSEYALRTLIRLGVAEHFERPRLSVSRLAELERLPYRFLEQVVATLREKGFVESTRGKLGGVSLARPQHEIGMGEVIRAVDDRLAPIGCASEACYEPCTCPDEDHCGLRMLMIDVRNAVAAILDRYSLGDVVDVTVRKMIRDHGSTPFDSTDALERVERATERERNADPSEGLVNLLRNL